jgi:hypothetical protein
MVKYITADQCDIPWYPKLRKKSNRHFSTEVFTWASYASRVLHICCATNNSIKVVDGWLHGYRIDVQTDKLWPKLDGWKTVPRLGFYFWGSAFSALKWVSTGKTFMSDESILNPNKQIPPSPLGIGWGRDSSIKDSTTRHRSNGDITKHGESVIAPARQV